MYILRKLLLCFSVCLLAQSVQAGVIYSHDFETTVGAEWSHTTTSITPTGDRSFLGQFLNDTVSLSLNNLSAHNFVTIAFDLFIIESWDGNYIGAAPNHEPDEWFLNVLNGPSLLATTFSNTTQYRGHDQNYSASDPVEQNSLGYSFHGDSVYRLSFTFAHTASEIQFDFFAKGLETSGLDGFDDESWGLDNVSVSTSASHSVPEPSTVLLLGIAVLGLVRRQRNL